MPIQPRSRRPDPAPRPRQGLLRGVTLVEIMVVVAVIAALISILVPALGIVRGQGRLVSSQSNLRSAAAFMTS